MAHAAAEYDAVQHQAQGAVDDPVWRIITGAAAFGAGVFVAGSVGTYNQADPSWNAATDAVVTNLFGAPGAVFADLARQTLGWSAWMAGIALMAGGGKRTLLMGAPSPWRWILGSMFVPLSAACFAAWPVPASWPLSTGLGGLLGDSLFSLAVMPFKALMLPMPEMLAGQSLGALALWCALSALGFGRRDARALQVAAGREGRRAAASAKGLTGTLAEFFTRLSERDAPPQDALPYADQDYRPDAFLVPEEDEAFEAAPARTRRPASLPAPSQGELPAPGPIKKAAKRRGADAAASAVIAQPMAVSELPPIDLLQTPPPRDADFDEDALLSKAARLTEVLSEFGVRGRIREVRPGPVVTLFELEPAPGVKSARVIALADDIARSMSATSARVAVIPGKNAIGIELPNEKRETVYFRSLLSSDAWSKTKASLPMALGEDIGGRPTVVELAKMPHLLIAGTTGSGKSVGVNAMILSLMYRLTSDQVRFIMIDPKMLELSVYEGVPHLLSPVVTDPKKAVNALKWAVREMESRYELMSKAGVRNLAGFNTKAGEYAAQGRQMTRKVQVGYDDDGKPIYETEVLPLDHIPNIVIVIDEMADLMMVAGKEIEACVQRLAQMARAAGIHLITATQRPSVDVITGTIKANFPTRISYMVTTKVDSRTILGEQGAEQLLGMGDLLYQAPGGKTKRLHGPFVSDEEVEEVVAWLKDQGEPNYDPAILDDPEDGDGGPIMDAMLGTSSGDPDEDLYAQALAIVIRDQRASTSYLQRRLKVGYNRAASLIERLEDEGVVSAPNHAGKREVLQRGEQPSD
ncbi:MAG: DNA translocase FtsK 4TM domain-containing protein [Pseudomonadota bacterium]